MDTIAFLNLGKSIEGNSAGIRSLGDDFHIYEIAYNSLKDYPFRICEYNCFICLRGETRGSIDLIPYHLKQSMMAINVPEQLIELRSISSDFKGIGITMSRNFVKQMGFPYNFQLEQMIRETPVLQLKPSLLEATLTYCRMVNRILDAKRPYQVEMLSHLTSAFIYGIGSSLYRINTNRHLSHDEMLTQKFLQTVRANCRKERKVRFYAEQLHVSLGHLFSVVKRVSDKSPGEWIDDYVTEEARALLKGTNLTIQQISYELGFPSQSFFGKFFKRVTGFSPKEYREK